MSRKRSKYSTGNDLLDMALREEKHLTARWYLAMSGQHPWFPGEREESAMKTERVSKVLREEFAKQTVEWFDNLPEGVPT